MGKEYVVVLSEGEGIEPCKMYSVPTVELPSFSFWQPWLHNYNLSFSAQPYIPQWDDLWMDAETAPQRGLQ